MPTDDKMVVLDSKEGFLIKRMESVLETPYDNGTRRLMGICAQDLVEWLLPGAFCTGKLSEKFESFDIEADAMQETLFYDKLALVHVEFQSGPDTGMAQRLLEYLVMAYRRYKCPVISYVVYLKKCALPKPPLVLTLPNGEECLRLNYKVIALPQTPYEELLAKGLKGLLPLVPLAHNGTLPFPSLFTPAIPLTLYIPTLYTPIHPLSPSKIVHMSPY